MGSRFPLDVSAWPNWITGDGGRIANGRAEARGGLGSWAGRQLEWAFGSLWANLKAGVQILVTTWAVTLPVFGLWLLSWWGGWENSFNKGYEQAWVGPALAALGYVLFLVLILFLPLAQARQSVSGQPARFFDLSLLWRIVRARPFACARLAFVFAAAGAVIMGLRIAPLAFGNLIGYDAAMTPERMEEIANLYRLTAAAAVFVLFVWLRMASARVYAKSLLNLVRAGEISQADLSPVEQMLFRQLDLEAGPPPPEASFPVRAMRWGGGTAWRTIGFGLALALWFAFVAEIYVAQFFNLDWIRWLNHPLIQLPHLTAPFGG
ncbi:MAG: hypothetical protein GY791_21065 [Alphaproteobacteria bacterium]|nr:hypothetical protein [Alphaproteobacteria bacterium]